MTNDSPKPSLLDPRAKLVLALGAAVLVAASPHLFAAAAQMALLVVLVAGRGLTMDYLRWLRLVLPMALFFGLVTGWTADAELGCQAALKLLAVTTVFFLFFATTAPEDLGNALVKIGLPFSLAFVMSASLNYVPVVGRKARDVIDAQRARGIPLEPGLRALRHYPAFLGPLLIQSLQMAEELAEAMEARGFGRPGRSFLKEYRLAAADWAAMVGALALAGAGLGWHFGV